MSAAEIRKSTRPPPRARREAAASSGGSGAELGWRVLGLLNVFRLALSASLLIAFLGAPVQPVLFWLLQWVVFTVASFIPTPGAAGGAEAAFFLVYSPFVPSEVLGLATAGWRFLTFYLLLGLASILYLLIGERRR